MAALPTEASAWNQQGIDNLKNKDYIAAIQCYDEALRRVSTKEHALPFILNRCQARIMSHHYEPALQDAVAALEIDPTSEKALHRAARASQCLRIFARCHFYLTKLTELYPEDEAAIRGLESCKIRLREESGEFDFASMLDEAISKLPSPRLERATYVGPIGLRKCAIESHGMGLFTTKAVKAGELLLCEKAFAAAFVPNASRRPNDPKPDESDWKQKVSRELFISTFVKLLPNPSLIPGFADLYPGPGANEAIDPDTNLPEINEAFVQNRIQYNVFGFPSIAYDYHWRFGQQDSEDVPEEESGHMGVWIKASYINHSCYPLVRRTYIGDMIIFRAQADLPADTELQFGYISCLETFEKRQELLKKWGFRCECQVCRAEKVYPPEILKKRAKAVEMILRQFDISTGTDLELYTRLLDSIESTYVTPPAIEPRKPLVGPLINLINTCHSNGFAPQTIELSLRLLHALGFETKITNHSFKITRWGFMLDEVVVALAKMCDGYKMRDGYAADNCKIYNDALEAAKTAYEIMCGERVSWDRTWGSNKRPKFGASVTGKVKD